MITYLSFMKDVLPPKEWYKVNRFVNELKTAYVPPVVSVYTPPREIDRVIRILEETERVPEVEEVETAIERELDSLRRSVGSICMFGWKAEEVVLKHLITSGDVPPVYVVDAKPFFEPLHDILEIRYDTLLILLDQKEALLKLYEGGEVQRQKRIKSYVGAKHHKGGWSQKRFSRIRETQVQNHLNRVQEYLGRFDLKSIERIIIAGSGNAKKDFARGHLTKELADKAVLVKGLDFSSSGEEIDAMLVDQLDKYRKVVESRQLSRVRERMPKELALTENREIQRALESGAVETILIASDYYAATPEEDERIIRMIEEAEHTSAEVEFITDERVLEELHKHGSVVASLRYRPF